MQKRTSSAAESSRTGTPPFVTVQAAVVFFLTSLLPAAAIVENAWLRPLSWVAIIMSAVSLFILSKRFIYLIPIVFALSLFSPSVYTLAVFAFVFGAVAAVGACAYLISRGGIPGFAATLIPSAAAYGAAMLITGDPLVSLSALLLLPLSLCAGITVRVSKKLSYAAVALAVTVCAALAAIFALDLYLSYGYLNAELVRSSVSAVEDILVHLLEDAMATVDVAVTGDVSLAVRNTVAAYINMIPGIVGALAMIFGYLVGSFFRVTARYCGTEDATVTDKLRITTLTALLFIIAHIVSFTTDASGNLSLVAIAASNIALILLPSLIIVSVRAIAALPRKLGIFGLILGIGIIFIVFSSSIYVLALVGTAYTLVTNIDEWAKDHYSKGGSENG